MPIADSAVAVPSGAGLPAARDLAWTALAECLADGPAALGTVVARIETAMDDSRPGFSVSAYLQGLVRDERIRLVVRHSRWVVETVDPPSWRWGAMGRRRG